MSFVSTDKTELVATNEKNQDSTDAVQQVCNLPGRIEEFQRQLKQLTGIEACQCRKARIQREFGGQMHLSANTRRNHIACALLVWVRLIQLAYQTGETVYALKHGLLLGYLIEQLKRPAIAMLLA